jgi:hypothetical protein
MARETTIGWVLAIAVALIFCSCAAPKKERVTPNQSLAMVSSQSGPVFDVLTQHNDSQRTGAYLHETILTPKSVQSGRFERLFHWKVDGQIYTQPLYVSRVPYKGRLINMVLVGTMKNRVYAFEAPSADSDVQPSKFPLWCVGNDVLGTPLPYDYFPMDWGVLGYNIKPFIGITATPVIDRKRGTIYLTAKSWSSRSHRVSYRLFALDLASGKLKNSIEIAPTFQGPDGTVSTFDPTHQLQRASLLEINDRLYLGFGSHQDTEPSHGWLIAYDADDLHQVAAYCTTCGRTRCKDRDPSSCMGGIWQAGGGPAADAEGNIYVMTGNGSYAPGNGDRATSFIKLDKDLRVVGSWTPATYDCLNRTDSDLGSAGPLFLSQTSTLVGGGKEGLLYALTPEALQGVQIGEGTPATSPRPPCYDDSDPLPVANGKGYWSIQAAPRWQFDAIMDFLRHFEPAVLSQGFHHIHGSPVVWRVHDTDGDHLLLYVSSERDLLRAYEFHNGFVHASPPGAAPLDAFDSACPNSSHGMPGGFLTLSATGDAPESGIVWAAMPRWDKDALHHIVPGLLRAYRAYPTAGSRQLTEIWNSDTETNVTTNDSANCSDSVSSGKDEVGNFAKYAPPTVAEGKVYLATFSNQLLVYGLSQTAPAQFAAATAASYDATLEFGRLPATVEPGRAVAISITALNTGTAVWRAGDGISLGSRTIPEDSQTPVENIEALVIRAEVPPGGAYTFNFHLIMPRYEDTYYFRWRLIRKGVTSKEPMGDWFGSSTREWKFVALRKDCAGLRERAKVVGRKIRPGQPTVGSLKVEIDEIERDARKRDCSLALDDADPMEQ